MIGTIRWNFMISFICGLFTFFFNVSSNVLKVALLNSLYCLVLVFALVFLFRWALGSWVGLKPLFDIAPPVNEEEVQPVNKGANVDLKTPVEDESINQLLKDQMNSQTGSHGDGEEFTPMNPPRLASKEKLLPEELARAIRGLAEEEGW
jgi:energy-coupling factor transporter transmembrane protein EcfT